MAEGRFLGPRRLPFRVVPRAGIAADAAGHVYAVDDREHRIHKVDPRATIVATWAGGCGDAPGQLFDPAGLAVDAAGRVYVADCRRALRAGMDSGGRRPE